MNTTPFKWNRSHSAVAGLLAVALLLVVVNTFRTTPASADESYDGKVMSAGNSLLMVQLAPDSDARSFEVAKEAKITKDGEKSSLDKLSMGDHVTVAVAIRDSREVATTIVARSPL